MSTSVLIPAAGSGSRMGTSVSKQFLAVQGKPILILTVERFQECAAIDEIVVAVHQDHIATVEFMVKEFHLTKVCTVVKGGVSRQQSVSNALAALDPACDIVLVQDSVRPFVHKRFITASIDAAREYGSAVVAVPVKDTIKQSGDGAFIKDTLDRMRLWAAQTPQTFRTSLLREAYATAERDGVNATDDASLVERMGFHPAIIEGSYENIKITTPEDLELAELIARRFKF
jgi:2-C-methyl-D-erythritol 4-phosphate cytidylyltransferase